MSSNRQFISQILETSAVGYAGMTASLLLERHPEVAARYEPDGFTNWKAQLQRWLLDLSAAIDAGEPKLFEARMLWTKKAFLAREAPLEDLQAALTALRDLLGERLPAGSAETAVAAVEGALAAVGDPRAGETGGIESDAPVGRPVLAYLETILEGRPREAVEQILDAVDGGTSIHDAYVNVLIPAQREAGRMWHVGELSIAEEHVITTTTQRAMAMLCSRAKPVPRKNKGVLLACVAGNVHDIGTRAIADFFEMAGWRTINLGPNVPEGEIARSVQLFDADLVVLAAALDPHLKAVQRTIDRIRALEQRKVKIIVGGPVFENVADLWRKVGADGYSARVEEAEPLGSRLTQE